MAHNMRLCKVPHEPPLRFGAEGASYTVNVRTQGQKKLFFFNFWTVAVASARKWRWEKKADFAIVSQTRSHELEEEQAPSDWSITRDYVKRFPGRRARQQAASHLGFGRGGGL